MRRIRALIAAAGFAASAAGAQTASTGRVQERAADARSETRISELITARTPPLGGPWFPVAVDGVVPPDIQLNSLPSEAEDVAPQLRGLRYIVVEELVAIVDPRTRKVEIVFPRWGKCRSHRRRAIKRSFTASSLTCLRHAREVQLGVWLLA